jgi:IclR family acetate operon transcriptional repressor
MSRDASRVQSIERAVAVLASLENGPIGVTEVAERAGLPKSTAARLLGSLAREGLVEQASGDTRYRIGPRIVSLAAGVRPTRSLLAIARPHLVELAAASGEAAGLSVPDGSLVRYVDQVDSTNPVAVRDWTGTRLPMHAVSSGLVMLAHLPPSEVDVALAGPLERFTANTVTDPAALRDRVRRAQVEGYAWTRDEFAEGITSIAAAISGEAGELIGAVHLHGPSYRFPAIGREPALEATILTSAARISGAIRQGSLERRS